MKANKSSSHFLNNSPKKHRNNSLLKKRASQKIQAHSETLFGEELFEENPMEPNMKLSHAFLVVLALHIVAVGGLFFFNHAKLAQQKSLQEKKETAAISSSSNLVQSHTTTSPQKESRLAAIWHALQNALPSHHPSATSIPEATTPSSTEPATRAILTKNESVTPPTPKITSTQSQQKITTLRSKNHPPLQVTSSTYSSIPLRGKHPLHPTAHPSLLPKNHQSIHHLPSALKTTTSHKAPHITRIATSSKTYTVAPGDTLYKIARRFHTSTQRLIKYNHLLHPEKLTIGKKLIIPPPTPSKHTSINR